MRCWSSRRNQFRFHCDSVGIVFTGGIDVRVLSTTSIRCSQDFGDPLSSCFWWMIFKRTILEKVLHICESILYQVLVNGHMYYSRSKAVFWRTTRPRMSILVLPEGMIKTRQGAHMKIQTQYDVVYGYSCLWNFLCLLQERHPVQFYTQEVDLDFHVSYAHKVTIRRRIAWDAYSNLLSFAVLQILDVVGGRRQRLSLGYLCWSIVAAASTASELKKMIRVRVTSRLWLTHDCLSVSPNIIKYNYWRRIRQRHFINRMNFRNSSC